MSENFLKQIIEAVLFVTGEPVNIKDIAKNLDFLELDVLHAVESLAAEYESQKRGLVLKKFGDHIQLRTRRMYAPYVEKMLQPVQRQSLSSAALETLAVVAYKQPVTRLDVEMVRGVKCDYSLQSLVNKELIEVCGRKDTIGRPFLYRTTDKFLSHFGISSLDELPKPEIIKNDEDDLSKLSEDYENTEQAENVLQQGDASNPENALQQGDASNPENALQQGNAFNPDNEPQQSNASNTENAPRQGDAFNTENTPQQGDASNPDNAPLEHPINKQTKEKVKIQQEPTESD
ncbi:MAG: SMC-Scp complex subunit ScpB [Christensenellales bacterium]